MESINEGVYYMRKSGQKILKRIASHDLSEEMNCINALQKTPFTINKEVLQVLDTVWKNNIYVDGLSRENIDPPPYPFDVAPDEMSSAQRQEFKKWRGKKAAIFQANSKSLSKRLQIERTLRVAKDFQKYDEFFYVWQLDFRSRKYPVSDFMNPQSADYGKALIKFAHGARIERDEDADWLAIHGANCYGEDKISLKDRIEWAYSIESDVVKTVEKPLEYTWWMTASSPFQFLAWCVEWYDYLKEGLGFVTHLPVSADGSCNGLQHLLAILRDEQGGKAVNLLPSSIPADIYQDVADATKLLVEEDAKDGNELAQQILDFGIDRKLTKKPVMVVPYSGTQYACRDYIQSAIQEKFDKGQTAPFSAFEASVYLNRHVWDSIGSVISSAREVMDFIKGIGTAYAEMQIPMEWMTPTNFLVIQDYPDLETQRIKTIIDGSIIRLSYREPIENTVCRGKTITGSSPNFIHSLDASALTKTVNRCMTEGIHNFAMVHDSYGTHCSNIPLMQQILRHEFVEMYENNDVLAQLRDHAINRLGHEELPELPKKGTLDLKQVLKSDYFFA